MSFQVEIDKQIKNGAIYFVGDALPPDWYAAFKTWSRLAEQGDMKSQSNTGWCYLYGEGTEGSRQKSKEWLVKAAAQNCPKSHWYLSRDYFGADEATRADHFKKALLLGDKLATNHEAELKKKAAEEATRVENEKRNSAIKLEQEKRENAYKNNALKIKQAFDDKKFDYAKILLDQMIADGFTGFIPLRSAMDVSLVNISAQHINVKGDLVSGGVVNGTTQTYQAWNSHIDVVYTVKNSYTSPSRIHLRYRRIGDEGVGVGFPSDTGEIPAGEEKRVSPTLSPSETMMLVPFVLIGYQGHQFQVPLKGYRKTNFPACKYELKNAGCFVLTACYNDENHPTVKTFREFRDNYLAKSDFGKRLIFLYYAYGPKAAEFVKNKPILKKLARTFFSGLSKLSFKKN